MQQRFTLDDGVNLSHRPIYRKPFFLRLPQDIKCVVKNYRYKKKGGSNWK